MAYCTGWTIPHIREELDLPGLQALRRQWAQFPPLPILVAHKWGAAKPKRAQNNLQRIEDQDVIPSQALSRSEFDAMLHAMKLPVPGPAKNE